MNLAEFFVSPSGLKKMLRSRVCPSCNGSMDLLGFAKRHIGKDELFKVAFDGSGNIVESDDLIPAKVCSKCQAKEGQHEAR